MTSPTWDRCKELLLYYFQVISILLAFHIIMFAISGDPVKYNILGIIPWEAGLLLFLLIVLGEQQRVDKKKLNNRDEKIKQLEAELDKIKNR